MVLEVPLLGGVDEGAFEADEEGLRIALEAVVGRSLVPFARQGQRLPPATQGRGAAIHGIQNQWAEGNAVLSWAICF